MHLARHAISSIAPTHVLDARFSADDDAAIFTTATPRGFAVYRSFPLQLLSKRSVPSLSLSLSLSRSDQAQRDADEEGTLAFVVPCHVSSVLFLVGGGPSPVFPPNKVVVWDDARGRAVAELEFRERVRGVVTRRGWLVVALRRRVVAFEIGETIKRYAEWETGDNVRGLIAMATTAKSTLLAVTGKQTGHVKLIHLPPCRPPAPTPSSDRAAAAAAARQASSSPHAHIHPKPSRNPVSIIAAHTSGLAALAVLPSGRLLATASDRGTLVRVWDGHSGKLVRELRRGSDKAEIYGIAFRPDERDVAVWSDKGTVHVFSLGAGGESSNRQSKFSPLAPFLSLPKYFDSEWSYAQYRIPSQKNHIALSAGTSGGKLSDAIADEKCTVTWVPVEVEIPSSSSGMVSPTSPTLRSEKKKGKEKERVHSMTSTAPTVQKTTEYQLIALTYSGGWYRLGLPTSNSIPITSSRPSSSGGATGVGVGISSAATSYAGGIGAGVGTTAASGPTRTRLGQHHRANSGSTVMSDRFGRDKGKGKDGEDKEKVGRDCLLLEYRRFGRWDGWG